MDTEIVKIQKIKKTYADPSVKVTNIKLERRPHQRLYDKRKILSYESNLFIRESFLCQNNRET
jgi:hypothetical protein